MSQPIQTDNPLQTFLPKALAAGVPQASLVGLLTANGWREKDVYRALGEHWRTTLGVEIPRRRGSGAGAREAFFYLLIFSTLATWTISLGCLAFQFINHWFPDPLFTPFQQLETYETTWSLAALLVAFPIYLLITRIVLKEAAADPAKLDSSIRKWLTYMALVIAASIFMSDLICALAFLLRGEITARFLLKALVVLFLSGGVFSYYFGGLNPLETTGASASPDSVPDARPDAVPAANPQNTQTTTLSTSEKPHWRKPNHARRQRNRRRSHARAGIQSTSRPSHPAFPASRPPTRPEPLSAQFPDRGLLPYP
jgi:hypothetical protein